MIFGFLTVLFVTATAWAQPPVLLAYHSEAAAVKVSRDPVDLTEVVNIAHRLDVEPLYSSRAELISGLKQNFLRIYTRQIDRAMFLSYPPPRDVLQRIVDLSHSYLELQRAIHSFVPPCFEHEGQGSGRLNPAENQLLQKIRKQSEQVDKFFGSMFLETQRKMRFSSEAAPGLEAAAEDYCSQVRTLEDAQEMLRQRLVAYFFSPHGSTVSVELLNLPSIRTLTGTIRKLVKNLEM